MAAFTVMATLTHLEDISDLLRQAAVFECLVQPIQRIASGLDQTEGRGCEVDQSSQDSPQPQENVTQGLVDPEEGRR